MVKVVPWFILAAARSVRAPSWEPLGDIFTSWGLFGRTWGDFLAFRALLDGFFHAFLTNSSPSWGARTPGNRAPVYTGAQISKNCGFALGRAFGRFWKQFWDVWGHSLKPVGPSWSTLGAPRAALGALPSCSGHALGPSLNAPGGTQSHLGLPRRPHSPPGTILDRFWARLGSDFEPICADFTGYGPAECAERLNPPHPALQVLACKTFP